MIKLPPESILVNPNDILKTCESVEMSTTPAVVATATTTSSSQDYASCTGETKQQQQSFVLVTKLAVMMHLQMYTPIHYFYHQYAHLFLHSTKQQNDNDDTTTTTTNDSTIIVQPQQQLNEELQQFHDLYQSIQPILHHHHHHNDNSFVTMPYSQFSSSTTTTTTSNSLSTITRQYYHNLYSLLNKYKFTDPIYTFAKELITSYRHSMVQLIESYYCTIDSKTCLDMLGYSCSSSSDSSSSSQQQQEDNKDGNISTTKEMNVFLSLRDWKPLSEQDNTDDNNVLYWSIPKHNKYNTTTTTSLYKNTKSDTTTTLENIEDLLEKVSFMEKKRWNV